MDFELFEGNDLGMRDVYVFSQEYPCLNYIAPCVHCIFSMGGGLTNNLFYIQITKCIILIENKSSSTRLNPSNVIYLIAN